MLSLDNVVSFSTIVSNVAIAASVAGAAISYVVANRRKRKEFVASEYRRFKSIPEVKQVLLMLDGGGTPIVVRDKDITHLSYTELFNTLRIHEHASQRFEPWEDAIRKGFQEFLEELTVLAEYLRSGIATESDLRPYLCFWLDLLCGKRWLSLSDVAVFWDHIDYYGFDDIRWFFERLDYLPPPPRVGVRQEQGTP
ncbi:MAG: hypothetical protein QM770_04490 [Tepidisphaeraceae bacterium]